MTTLSRAIRRNVETLMAEWPRAARGDRRAVHRVRVATRRLRAALPLAAEAGDVDARAFAREWRDVTRVLGAVREMDVVRALLKTSAKRLPWTPSAVAFVDAQCAARRDTLLSSMRARLSRVDATELGAGSHAVADRLERVAPVGMVTIAVCAAVGRRARRFARALHDAGTVFAAERLHQLRLATKKLRYTLEAGAGTLGGSEGRDRRLERFQDVLGQIHDAQTARHYLRVAAATPGVSRALMSRVAQMDRALEIRCRRLHAHVLKTKPEMDETVREILQTVAARVAPKHVGRMARMQTVRIRRRPAVGD